MGVDQEAALVEADETMSQLRDSEALELFTRKTHVLEAVA